MAFMVKVGCVFGFGVVVVVCTEFFFSPLPCGDNKHQGGKTTHVFQGRNRYIIFVKQKNQRFHPIQ